MMSNQNLKSVIALFSLLLCTPVMAEDRLVGEIKPGNNPLAHWVNNKAKQAEYYLENITPLAESRVSEKNLANPANAIFCAST